MQNLIGMAAITLAALSSLTVPAFAVTVAPGPLVGVGLPALVVLGGACWLVRKLRNGRAPN